MDGACPRTGQGYLKSMGGECKPPPRNTCVRPHGGRTEVWKNRPSTEMGPQRDHGAPPPSAIKARDTLGCCVCVALHALRGRVCANDAKQAAFDVRREGH